MELITTREAGVYLRVTPETIRKYVRAGRLRALMTPSGRILVAWQDVEQLAPPDRLLRGRAIFGSIAVGLPEPLSRRS